MAESGYLGEEKQNGSSGVLDGKECRKALASLSNIARLPARTGTKQLSARRTIPAPTLIGTAALRRTNTSLPLDIAFAVS